MAKTALILDFGGVITKTLFEQHRRTEQVLGLASGSLAWLGPIAPDTDALWRRVERGDMTEGAYWAARAQEVGRLVGEMWDNAAVLFRRAQGGDPNATVRPEAVAAIHRLRARNVRVAVLSNELERFYGPAFRTDIDLLSSVDAVVDGTRTNICKPDRRAYEMCLEALGAKAAEAVFADDQGLNVEAARTLGLEAIHFDIRDPGRSYADIEARFVQSAPPPD